LVEVVYRWLQGDQRQDGKQVSVIDT
jgi:hypothetical protein